MHAKGRFGAQHRAHRAFLWIDATFRLASMHPGLVDEYLYKAERIYQAVQGALDPLGNFVGVQVVDVLSFSDPGKTSVESLAFALLLASARRDFHVGNVTSIGNVGAGNGSDVHHAKAKVISVDVGDDWTPRQE